MEVKRYNVNEDFLHETCEREPMGPGDCLVVTESDHLATIAELTRERDELNRELQILRIMVAKQRHKWGVYGNSENDGEPIWLDYVNSVWTKDKAKASSFPREVAEEIATVFGAKARGLRLLPTNKKAPL